MNDKIKELAVTATLKHFPSFDNVVLYGDYSKSSYNKEIEDMMFVFAELIVKECSSVASMFSIEKNDIHPNISWNKMNETSKMVAHITCQDVARKILEHFGVE